jgi:hydroxyquinol 1,2-dioxygenase
VTDFEGTTPAEITNKVVASFQGCPDARLRQLMQSLVTHVHRFAREVGLTRQEWGAAIAALTATGRITTDERQEFILWSDVLGVSMLVDALAQDTQDGATESTVLGPFYVANSPWREFDDSISEVPAGPATRLYGFVRDTAGAPVQNATVDVWQNGSNRLYAVQDPDAPPGHLRGRFRTRKDGSYSMITVEPVPYPIPYDGPVGDMLNATNRHPWRPAHVHLSVSADGFQPLVTHIFDAKSEFLDSDAVFAVKGSLVRDFLPHAYDDPDRPTGATGTWYSVENDIVLLRAH